ncbi:MAG: hypothetical protein J6386_18860 [Candidatus Synoicihabitans palmerolidicus]|nr:hypothetical protein [Candidatus Synoicihabitans palmerolidicus]
MIQNIIFSRTLYQQQGGFRDFPLGIWTDIVVWTDWARAGGIHTLATGSISFRIHDGGYCGHTLWGGGDRIGLIRLSIPALTTLLKLFEGTPIRAPQLGLLNWFARIFRYGSNPLNSAESAEMTKTLRAVWPRWPIVRQIVFWWHTSRPWLRHHPLTQALNQRSFRRHGREDRNPCLNQRLSLPPAPFASMKTDSPVR